MEVSLDFSKHVHVMYVYLWITYKDVSLWINYDSRERLNTSWLFVLSMVCFSSHRIHQLHYHSHLKELA